MLGYQLAVLFLLGTLEGIRAGCPDSSPMEGFKPEKFLGRWNIVEWVCPDPEERQFHCVHMNFVLDTSGKVAVNRTGIRASDGTSLTYHGYAYGEAGNPEARLSVDWNGKEFTKRTFTVVDSDYETYAVATCCSVLSDGTVDLYAHIFARDTDMPEGKRKKLRRLLRKNGLESATFAPIVHDCHQNHHHQSEHVIPLAGANAEL